MTEFPGRRRVLALMLASVLTGCGDDEAAQRKAFIAFLQSRVLDKPGVHVPRPTADEVKSWGDYAQHYAIITDFNENLNQRVSTPMAQAIAKGSIQSLPDLLARRDDLVSIRQGTAELRAELDRQLAKAESARAALTQPADLKPVFDAAFDRDVAGLGHAFQAALPPTEDGFTAAIELADYLAQHRSAVRFNGMQVIATDPAVEHELRTRMTVLNAKGQELLATQRRLASMISGAP